jgi:hypothetical protein
MSALDSGDSGLHSQTVKLARSLLLGAISMVLVPVDSALWAEETAARWVEVRTAHFVVASNASEGEARGVAEDFERIRSLFSQYISGTAG